MSSKITGEANCFGVVENNSSANLNKVEWRISLTPTDDRSRYRITPKEFTVQVNIWSLCGPTAKIPSIWHHEQGIEQNLTFVFHPKPCCMGRCLEIRLWWGFYDWIIGTPGIHSGLSWQVSSTSITTLCCGAGLSSWTGCNPSSQFVLALMRRQISVVCNQFYGYLKKIKPELLKNLYEESQVSSSSRCHIHTPYRLLIKSRRTCLCYFRLRTERS